jgi:chromatin assembly factor 1 subunit A
METLGTWTKSSAFVGPRTPLAKDLVTFDYSYDSGEDWEEEPEDAEEVNSANGDESEESAGEEEDEFDGWLVGDDEVEDGEEVSGEGRSVSPSPAGVTNGVKRKNGTTSGSKEPSTKKRKVVPLVPFIKGPCWENTIGICEHEVFRPFCIQLLNGRLFNPSLTNYR